jgi:hypothetical protein
MPVEGGFFGAAATSTLEYQVEIETEPARPLTKPERRW